MTTITTETTVGDLVRTAPARARVFERLGIDYCCGGKQPLAEACRARGLDAATVVAMLSALDATPPADLTDVDGMSLAELCDHIEQTHHAYLREELPRLDFMTGKVAAVHGKDEPRLIATRRIFEKFSTEMVAHMRQEEEQVFPHIRELELGVGDRRELLEELQRNLTGLEVEHATAGVALAHFRELTNNFTPPDWACNTFRALYDALARLEQNMHQHVHKENNVLFPRALALSPAELD